MKEKLLLMGLLLFLLVLSSCGPPDYRDVPVYVGTEGLNLAFMDDSYRLEMYENTLFPVAIWMSNDGAFNLNGSYKATISYSYNSHYLEPVLSTAEWERNLRGRSKNYPVGEITYLDLPDILAKEIQGERQNPETSIFVSVCYPYQTFFADEICIDVGGDLREKVCEAAPKTYRGQGGPVAVREVRAETQLFQNYAKPSFLITITDVGGGSILAPYDESDVGNACQMQKKPEAKPNWNSVRISAKLFNEDLVCTPEKVQIRDGRGLARCSLESSTYAGSQNYLANLVIELDYVYTSSISKTISIFKSEIEPPRINKVDCKDWEIDIGGDCVEKCKACATNPFLCKGTDIDSTWGCNCKKSSCITIKEGVEVKNSSCIIGDGFCEGDYYCCSKQ